VAIADVAPELSAEPARAGLQALAATPYLRHLAALVLLGTLSATLLDYVFKAEAVRAFGRGDELLRFFAVFYGATTLLTFVVQASASRVLLARFGLPAATATPSAAVLLGGSGALLFPGLTAATIARGGETVFRGSLFRAGYEVFYTPLPARERRAAKSIIDVGADRAGDATGGLAVSIVQILASAHPAFALYTLAITCSAVALIVTTRLSRGYLQMLEQSLLSRAVELDLSEVQDFATR
jgi:ATP/ADP translocase